MKKSFLSLLFILFISCYCLALNLGEILTDIRVQVKDVRADRWTDAILIPRVDMIQDELVEQTKCLVTRISTATLEGQREYRYPSDMIARPIRVAYLISNSTPPAYQPLSWYSIAGLDKDIGVTWEQKGNGLPLRYYERGQVFGLDPKPSSVYCSTFSVQIDYYQRASTMSAYADIPFNGNPMLYIYHKLLILGVVIMCKEEMGVTTTELKQQYYALVNKMSDEIRTGTNSPQQLIIGVPPPVH